MRVIAAELLQSMHCLKARARYYLALTSVCCVCLPCLHGVLECSHRAKQQQLSVQGWDPPWPELLLLCFLTRLGLLKQWWWRGSEELSISSGVYVHTNI